MMIKIPNRRGHRSPLIITCCVIVTDSSGYLQRVLPLFPTSHDAALSFVAFAWQLLLPLPAVNVDSTAISKI